MDQTDPPIPSELERLRAELAAQARRFTEEGDLLRLHLREAERRLDVYERARVFPADADAPVNSLSLCEAKRDVGWLEYDGSEGEAEDCERKVKAWLAGFLGYPVELERKSEQHGRVSATW